MTTRGFSRLRALWATCQGIRHQQHVQSMNPSSAKVFSMMFSRYACVQAAAKEPASAAAGGGEALKKKRKKRKKTFMEVAQFLPEWGQGAKFTKSHWPPGNFYTVSKVKVYKSGRHGAAWGVFHEQNVPKTGELQKIGGVNKRCWRYVPEGDVAAIMWKRSASERPLKHVPLISAEIVPSAPVVDV